MKRICVIPHWFAILSPQEWTICHPFSNSTENSPVNQLVFEHVQKCIIFEPINGYWRDSTIYDHWNTARNCWPDPRTWESAFSETYNLWYWHSRQGNGFSPVNGWQWNLYHSIELTYTYSLTALIKISLQKKYRKSRNQIEPNGTVFSGVDLCFVWLKWMYSCVRNTFPTSYVGNPLSFRKILQIAIFRSIRSDPLSGSHGCCQDG